MARYKIYDCFRGEYLDETRNYAEDLPEPNIGWHVHMEDAAGLTGTRIFVATPPELPESLGRCEKVVRFENGKLDTDIVCKEVGIMAGKIGIDVTVATPEINGRIEVLAIYSGEEESGMVVMPADSGYTGTEPSSLWEVRIGPHPSNAIASIGARNTGDESLYLSGEIVITSPDGTSATHITDEKQTSAGAHVWLPLIPSGDIGTTVGTYKCEVKLYGRRSTSDTKQLLDTDIFYVHNYTEAIDIPAPTTADYEYRTAETLAELETASWSPVGTSLVIHPNWWLQFRFNITNNGDEPVNVHIREKQDSKSKIAMTVTDPGGATSLLPVYMKQIAPGTSKKVETLGIQLTTSGSWHFEGYVYAQRAYNRILDVNEDGEITSSDAFTLSSIVQGAFDSNNDGYITDDDIKARNSLIKPYWTHYAYTNFDHVTTYDMLLLMKVAAGIMTEAELWTPPEDAFVLQYDPFIIHAYGKYYYYDGTNYQITTNEDEAKANAASGFKALRIEDGKLVTF